MPTQPPKSTVDRSDRFFLVCTSPYFQSGWREGIDLFFDPASALDAAFRTARDKKQSVYILQPVAIHRPNGRQVTPPFPAPDYDPASVALTRPAPHDPNTLDARLRRIEGHLDLEDIQ